MWLILHFKISCTIPLPLSTSYLFILAYPSKSQGPLQNVSLFPSIFNILTHIDHTMACCFQTSRGRYSYVKYLQQYSLLLNLF